MLITTQDTFSDAKIEKTFGLVKGNTVRAKHIGKDIIAGFRGIFGGEVNEYSQLMTEAREQASERMIQAAEAMGANAIVGARFSTSMVMQNASEVLVYGTAVKIK